jgi:hypothetical protein
MRVPQVNERVKEAPAQALRAMFASIGQLLLFTDKLRNRPPEGETTTEESPVPAQAPAPEAEAPQAKTPQAETPQSEAPQAEAAQSEAPQAEAAEAPTAQATAAPDAQATAAPDAETAAAPDTAEPPLPNYDELTIPSLRARLRNLSIPQLNQLVEYEKSHANRADVIAMFERRIAKLAEG